MLKRTTIIMAVAFAFATFTGSAIAADQIRDRDPIKDQIKDKLKDGSCKGFSFEAPAGNLS